MSLTVDPDVRWLFDAIAGDSPGRCSTKIGYVARRGGWDQFKRNAGTTAKGFRRLAQRVTGHISGVVATNFQSFVDKLASVGIFVHALRPGLLPARDSHERADCCIRLSICG